MKPLAEEPRRKGNPPRREVSRGIRRGGRRTWDSDRPASGCPRRNVPAPGAVRARRADTRAVARGSESSPAESARAARPGQRAIRTKSSRLLLLGLLLVVGLYVGAYLAWQKYQAEKAALAADPLGTLKNLLV